MLDRSSQIEPCAISERAGFERVANGGGTTIYRKRFRFGDVIISGFDGDLPDHHWYAIGLYRNWDDCEEAPLMFVSDASAEYSDFEARNFGDDLTLMIEFAGGL